MAQLVSVTPQLIAEMNRAQKYEAGLSEGRANDRKNYAETVEVLAALVQAVLTATASTPLITAPIAGPRFDVAGEGLSARLRSVVEYLRENATHLVQNPGDLSPYERAETDRTLARIRALCAHLASAIEDQVVQDIRTARNQGVAELINVAGIVSAAVRQTQPAGGQSATDGER